MFRFRSPAQKILLPAPPGSQCHEVGAAAIRAEMKADLEAAVRVSFINLVVALDPKLGFSDREAGRWPFSSLYRAFTSSE